MFKNREGQGDLGSQLEDVESAVDGDGRDGKNGEDGAAIKDIGVGRDDGENAANREKYFRRLYDETFPILFRVAYRISNSREAAEDLCHDSFIRLHEKNMVFPNPEEAKYWLIRVVKNTALNYAKRKERERKAYQRAFREEYRREETGENLLVRKETREEVQQALKKLPENLRMALILKEYTDMNYKEIGKVLGLSDGNVKVRVFRARERLAALLQGGANVS